MKYNDVVFFNLFYKSLSEAYKWGRKKEERKEKMLLFLLFFLMIIGSCSDPIFASRYPERDSKGKLWIEKNILDTEKNIVVPDGTTDIRIEGGTLFILSQDRRKISKIDLANQEKISFFMLKYIIKKGTESVPIMERFEQVFFSFPVTDWTVAGEKIYVLKEHKFISEIDSISGDEENLMLFPFPVEGIAVEGKNLYTIAPSNKIFCFDLKGSKQWEWSPWTLESTDFKKIKVRNGVIYTVSDDQVFRIKIGKIDLKKKEVRQSSVVSTSKSTTKIVDFLVSDDKVIALNEKGVIRVYDPNLDGPLGSFCVEGAQAVEMEGNRLYILIPPKNQIRVFEFFK